MNRIISIVFVLFMIAGYAYPSTPEDVADRIMYIHNQLFALDIEMLGAWGWEGDVKGVAERNIRELKELLESLRSMKTTKETEKYIDAESEFIKKQIELYDGFENKSNEEIEGYYKALRDIKGTVVEWYGKELEKSNSSSWLSGEKAYYDIEVGVFKDTDKEQYKKAERYRAEGRYKEAYEIYVGFLPAYTGMQAEHLLLIRMSDCIARNKTDLDTGSGLYPEEEALGFLRKIIDGDMYSPFLYEAYVKWRVNYQSVNHGFSNMSEIPNKMYNEKRWAMIGHIKNYLRNNYGDGYARAQVIWILLHPNISRDANYGNSGMAEWAMYYTDIFEDDTDSTADAV